MWRNNMIEIIAGVYSDDKPFIVGLEKRNYIALRFPKEGTICGHFTLDAGVDPNSGKYIYSNQIGFTPTVATLSEPCLNVIQIILKKINSKINEYEMLTTDEIIRIIEEEINWEEVFNKDS
jgi:hypothetical protein